MKIYTENFTIILNKHITNKDIDTYEFRVLCYLLLLADEKGTCYPSYKTIASKIGISESKAKDAIKKLISLSIIKKDKRKKANGSAGSNLYVVCEKTTVKINEVAENTTPCVQEDSPGSVQKERGGVSDDYNKYSNINNNYFNNNHLSSIEDVIDRAEIYNLHGETKKNYESALKIMFGSKSISVGGQDIPHEIVRRRLKNISYEHIVYVDNNMPRKMINGKAEIQVRSPVPYIVTSLYNALQYTTNEIIKMECGEEEFSDKNYNKF